MAIDKVLSCIWSVAINGKVLDLKRKRCITSINIDTACDGSDVATIAVVDKDLEFINDNIFVEEATISITLMFVGSTDKIQFNGYVSTIDIDFPEEGMPTMTLTCLDNSHVMNRTKKKRSWSNVTRLQVAQKIAQEYGFKFDGEPSYGGTVEETISQSDETDIEFLEKLASEEDDLYMCKLVGDMLRYRKKALLGTPVMTVHYKKYPYEVKSFSPRINKETMQNETTVADVSTDTKKVDTATSSGSDTGTQGEKVSGGDMVYNPQKQGWKYTDKSKDEGEVK